MASYSPTSSALSSSELSFHLSKFLRSARTELSCLEGKGRLNHLLDQLGIVLDLEDRITNRGPGGSFQKLILFMIYFFVDGGVISEELMEKTIQDIYESIESVKTSLTSDWLTSSSVTTTLLLSKLTGFSLITWGRNLGDWPQDVPLTSVQTGYKVGILGRALLYSLFVLDDFRYIISHLFTPHSLCI